MCLSWVSATACVAAAQSEDVSAQRTETNRAPPFVPEALAPPPIENAGQPPARSPAGESVPARQLPRRYLAFDQSCDEGDIVTIAAVGDILLHRELQRQAYVAPDRFANLWGGVIDLLSRADVTYANLESPAAYGIARDGSLVPDPGLVFDDSVYSGYAKFNVHPSIAIDLKSAGVDIVSTANNHALDRGSLGIDRTIEALDDGGIAHTGTRTKGSDEPWHAITVTGGLRIAWIACTLHTNFGKDDHGQVLHCFDLSDPVSELVTQLRASADVDAVIVTPHWGKEYATRQSPRQIEYAQKWIDAGAIAIIGSHPHVLEPWEKRIAKDGREAFVAYSLGNFVSHQRSLERRSSIVLVLGLRKGHQGVRVVGARYVPIHVAMEGDKERFSVEAIDLVHGPNDVRRWVVRMFGEPHRLDPDAPFVVNPHCSPDWPNEP